MDHADADAMAVFADTFILPEEPAAIITPPRFFERFAPSPSRFFERHAPRDSAPSCTVRNKRCGQHSGTPARVRPAFVAQPNYIYWMLVLIIIVLVAILLARPVVILPVPTHWYARAAVSGAPALVPAGS